MNSVVSIIHVERRFLRDISIIFEMKMLFGEVFLGQLLKDKWSFIFVQMYKGMNWILIILTRLLETKVEEIIMIGK